MSKVIYTAVFGDKDNLKNIPKSNEYDCVVFTDNKYLVSDNYRVVVCPELYEDPTRNAKMYKILSHKALPNYEYSLWLDASITMEKVDVDSLFNRHLSHRDIALHAHPVRDCIYDEAAVCIELHKDSPDVIRRQMNKYKSDGYPEKNGLVSAGILFRKHSPKIAKLNTAWWREIGAYSRRDQLSFNYVAWKNRIDYFAIEGFVGNKGVDGFSISTHAKKESYRYW